MGGGRFGVKFSNISVFQQNAVKKRAGGGGLFSRERGHLLDDISEKQFWNFFDFRILRELKFQYEFFFWVLIFLCPPPVR